MGDETMSTTNLCNVHRFAFARRRLRHAASLASLLFLTVPGCADSDAASEQTDPYAEESDLSQIVTTVDAGPARDAAAADVDAAVGTAARPTKLTFKVQTAPFGGRYKPKNIGAIWIETSTGTFVKTVERWARIRARFLTRFAASSKNNLVDAVSSATLANHRVHTVTWNLTDVGRKRVPDGAYRLAIELTDRDGPGALVYVPFTLGASPVKVTPATTPQFSAMELRVE